MKFVNLHHHSTFSFGDGFGTPAQHVRRAARLGYKAMALTEHGNVSSHFQFEKEALKQGIKPIFGLEAYCGPVEDKTRRQFKYHLTILAKNLEGYRSLNRIVTQSYKDFYFFPTVSAHSLIENREGLVVLSGCSGSLLACTLLGGKGEDPHPPDMKNAIKVIERFGNIFGEDYYLEVQPFYELEKTSMMNECYEDLSRHTGVPIVVTHDVHYPTMDDSEMQAVLHASHRGTGSVEDAMRSWNYDVPLTLPESDNELAARLELTGMSAETCWDAITNSEYIASICNVTLPKAERLRYPIDEEDLKPWT